MYFLYRFQFFKPNLQLSARINCKLFGALILMTLTACEPYKVKSPPVSAQGPKKFILSPFKTETVSSSTAPVGIQSFFFRRPTEHQVVKLKPPKSILDQVRIGLLLPLSGPNAALGQTMMEASFLAIFDGANDKFVVLPRDTRGTPQGAKAAAQDAINSGARLLIGPVFGKSAKEVAPLAAEASINLISFTNDRTVAAEGTFVFGFLPEDRLHRIVGYAASKGIKRFAALVPHGKFGEKLLADYERTIKAFGATFVSYERYLRNTKSITSAIKRLGDFQTRRKALILKRNILKKKNDPLSKRILKKLAEKTVLGSLSFDAVLIPETGKDLKAIVSLLSYYEIDRKQVKFIGIHDWSSRSLIKEPSLAGAWYVGLSPQPYSNFVRRFASVFKKSPHQLSAFAYDAMALSSIKAREGPQGFSLDKLTAETGFYGSAGLFRLRPTGAVQHMFSVMEVTPKGVEVVSPSPISFSVSKTSPKNIK